MRHLHPEVVMKRDVPVSILIIGEDSHFGYLMRSYVRRSAHNILYSYPEKGVVDLIQREQPAAIILDVDQHAMGGWTLLRTLKSNTDTCHIPVVICSWADEKERGVLEGASVYLRMPILYGDFLEALSTIGLETNSKAV